MLAIIAYTIVTALVIIISVLVVRTIRAKAGPQTRPAPEPIDIDFDGAVKCFQTMLRIPTTSHHDPKLVDQKKFEEFHEAIQKLFPNIYRVCEVTHLSHCRILRWKGPTPATVDPVLLMAHIDTVPPGDLSLWEHGPFDGDIANGELWGRGAIDTKSTVLGTLFGVETAIKHNRTPKQDIYISLCQTEEVQGPGVHEIIGYLKEHKIHLSLLLDEGGIVYPNLPIVEKPTVLIGISEKGYCDLKVTVPGTGGHASMPPDHTALGILAQAITIGENHPYAPHIPEPVLRMAKAIGPHVSFLPRLIFSNMWLFKSLVELLCLRVLPQSSPLRAMFRTTQAWTMAEGSDQSNVLPKSATAMVNLRLMDPETPEGARDRLQKLVGGLGAEVTLVSGVKQDPVSESWGWQWEAFEETAKDVWGDETVVTPVFLTASTDSAHISREGLCNHVYRLDPFAFALKLIHNVNERIPVKSVHQCVNFYTRLVYRLTKEAKVITKQK